MVGPSNKTAGKDLAETASELLEFGEYSSPPCFMHELYNSSVRLEISRSSPPRPHAAGSKSVQKNLQPLKVQARSRFGGSQTGIIPEEGRDHRATSHQADLKPVMVKPSLRARAYKALKSAITDLDIYDHPTEIRLDERDLSERLGVSRTPVREALSILEYQGFVRSEPRRGIYVVKKTEIEIVDMVHACAALEAMAARLACMKATDVQLRGLRESFSAFYDPVLANGFASYFEARWRFCRYIAELSQSDDIVNMIDHLLLHLRSVHDVIFRQDVELGYLRAAYMAIIEALEARDAERASHLVRDRGLRFVRDIASHAVCFDPSNPDTSD